MAHDTFQPPEYEESLHLLFDKETGKVVASERRWTLVDKTPQTQRTSRTDLLEKVIAGLGRRAEEFDVLVLTGPEASKAPVSHVDVHHRRPVRDEGRPAFGKIALPFRTEGP